MADQKLSNEELMHHVQEQIGFLVGSCNSFDNGNLIEAKRIALTLRILLHDTKQSKSLLGQIGLKSSFFDTQYIIDLDIKMVPTVSSELLLISQLHDNPIHQFKPNFSSNLKTNKIDFQEWWNQIVIRTIDGAEFSRSKIILAVANQDGGAHVDPELEQDYYNLTRLNSIQHFFADNLDLSQGLPEKIELSQLQPVHSPLSTFYTIRQTAHEVLISKIDPEKSNPKLETIYPFNEALYNGNAIHSIGLF